MKKIIAQWFGLLALGMALVPLSLSAETFTVRLQNSQPTFTGSIYSGAEDTYLREAYPEACPGKYNELNAGFETTIGGGRCRPLIRYDLNAVKSAWQSSSTVKSARLKIFLTGKLGTSFTNKTLALYRITAANKTWSAGTNADRLASTSGAACWKWRSFDNSYYEINDPRCPGCMRRNPWASDIAVWNDGHGTVASVVGGCGVVGTDLVTTPVATAQISDASVGSWITLEFTDISFLADWINTAANNAGFMLRATDLEAGTTTNYATLRFPSSESTTESSRPIFEIDIDNFNTGALSAIRYTLPRDSRVSLHISDNTGKVVKEMLFAADRKAGTAYEFWDCKDAPALKGDSARVVPDGEYTVKILQTQGLTAEYIHTLGTTATTYDGWVSNHWGPAGIAVDSSGVYIGGGNGEGAPVLLKMTRDGVRIGNLVQGGSHPWESYFSMASDGNRLFALRMREMCIYPKDMTNPPAYSNLKRYMVSTIESDMHGKYPQWVKQHNTNLDIAIRKGKLLVSSDSTKKIYWVDTANGTHIGTDISVPNVAGVAVGLDGKGLVISGTEVWAFTQGSSAHTVLITGLTAPWRLDISPVNGDIYVVERGTSQQIKRFASTGGSTPLNTYGIAGGRVRGGFYNPAGFLNINDIAVDIDGSFWISEGYTPPRRVAHIGLNGQIIKAWYGGILYAGPTILDEADPTVAWCASNYSTVTKMQINWQNRTWEPREIYYAPLFEDRSYFSQTDSIPFANDWPIQNWVVRHYGGKTFLCALGAPTIYYYDEVNKTLRMVSSMDSYASIPMKYLPQRYLPATADTNYWRFTYSWADQNADRISQNSEITYFDDLYLGQYSNGFKQGSYVDTDLTYIGGLYDSWPNPFPLNFRFGPSVFKPDWTLSSSGVPVPRYKADYRTPGAANTIFDNYHSPYELLDSTYVKSVPITHGFAKDDAGNLFGSYSLNSHYNAVNDTDYFSRRIIKWDASGKKLWEVGRKATKTIPDPGDISTMKVVLGSVKGCFAVSDMRPHQYVWDRDGLWVGQLLEQQYSGSAPLTATQWSTVNNLCDEQFAGRVYEIKNNNTPGLTKGDVIYIASHWNSAPVFKIRGWDQFYKLETKITVAAGKIVSQSDVAVKESQPAGSFKQALSLKTGVVGSRSVITCTIPVSGMVTLEIYSILGQKIASLVNDVKTAGTFSVAVGSSDAPAKLLTSGFYIVRLAAGGKRLTKQLVMTR